MRNRASSYSFHPCAELQKISKYAYSQQRRHEEHAAQADLPAESSFEAIDENIHEQDEIGQQQEQVDLEHVPTGVSMGSQYESTETEKPTGHIKRNQDHVKQKIKQYGFDQKIRLFFSIV